MSDIDAKLKAVIESGGIETEPDPVRMGAVRERMLHISRMPAARITRPRTIVATIAVVVTLCIVGVAATEAGRKILRWIYTPVMQTATTTFETGLDANGNRDVVGIVTTDARTFSDQEMERMKRRLTETHQIKQAGGGRLTGLIEIPGPTAYVIEYRLSDGTCQSMSSGRPSGLQAKNMRIDEIDQLRDAGQGQLIASEDFPIGLGRFNIRFTLSDGKTVDLVTNYPPGTRQERETIFAETRTLKRECQFKVDNASRDSHGRVHGLLQYKLADGRVVGITEDLPEGVISPDGKGVVVGETEHTAAIPSGGFAGALEARKARERMQEYSRVADAGGGRLVAIFDNVGSIGQASMTLYRIQYTLSDGTNDIAQTNVPTEKQRANFKLSCLQQRMHSYGDRLIPMTYGTMITSESGDPTRIMLPNGKRLVGDRLPAIPRLARLHGMFVSPAPGSGNATVQRFLQAA